LAFTQGYANLSIFALDRIVSIKEATAAYVPNKQSDFDKYFDDIIGISKPKDGVKQDVRLWINRNLLPYIITKPMHHSQTIIEEYEDGDIIQIALIPNYELEQLILSYGEQLIVLSPQSLREKIKEKTKNSSKNYD